MKSFIDALFSYFDAHQLIIKYRLWNYFFIPGLFSLLYAILLIIAGVVYFDNFAQYITENWIPQYLTGAVMAVFLQIILWLLLILIAIISYKYVVLIFFSPLLSGLSEKVEIEAYKLIPPKAGIAYFLKDMWRGLVINIRNLLWELVLSLLVLLLNLIPLIGTILAAILLLVIQSFYSGFGFIDYTLERKRYSLQASKNYAKKQRPLLIGVGLGFTILLFIPLFGWFIAPAYATVAATISYRKAERTSTTIDDDYGER